MAVGFCNRPGFPGGAAGFPAGFLSGFSVAAARAGAPDTGLLSYAEVLDSARCAVEVATPPPPPLPAGQSLRQSHGLACSTRTQTCVPGLGAAAAVHL